jgi:hypothetical protein
VTDSEETSAAAARRNTEIVQPLGTVYRQFRRLRAYVHKKLPAIFSNPTLEEHLRWCRERDDEENEALNPPHDEIIRLHCLWAGEIYTPSQIDNLLSGLARLDWGRDDLLPDRDVAQWVRRSRESSLGGGWLNVGVITRPGDNRFWNARSADLPEHVDYAFGSIFALTSAVTCLVINFVFDEHYANQFELILRRRHQSTIKKAPRGYSIYQPTHLKTDEVANLRRQLVDLALEWFRKNVPGLFCSGPADQKDLPTCEFVTLTRAEPFPKPEEKADYLHVLQLEAGLEAWHFENIAGLKLARRAFAGDDLPFHTILTVNEHRLRDQELAAYGGHTRDGYVNWLHHQIPSMFSRLALVALLTRYERDLNAIRDSTLFGTTVTEAALRRMRRVAERFSGSVDISAIAADMQEYCAAHSAFQRGFPRLLPAEPRWFEPAATLGGVLQTRLSHRAARLERAERSVRDLLIQHGTLLSATENISLQNSIRFLTWIMAGLTLFIFVLTALMAMDQINKLL